MTELKPCRVCNSSRQRCYGLAVSSLDELKIKGAEALGINPGASISLLLEEDGTIVEDQAYFRCLPANTKFMLLQENDIWMHSQQTMVHSNRESAGLEVDRKDCVDGVESWHGLAEELRKNLASIILMSEADLQLRPRVSAGLLRAENPGSTGHTTENPGQQGGRETGQRATEPLFESPRERTHSRTPGRKQGYDQIKSNKPLDGATELVVDPSIQVLSSIIAAGAEPDETDGGEVQGAAGLSSTIIMTLREGRYPQTRLSTKELQVVVNGGVDPLMQQLRCNRDRALALLQACERELSKRLEKVRALQALYTHNQTSSTAGSYSENKVCKT
ncbi:hypothetical protein DNTS_005358 [Danionella cerebrum]|uniref:CIDE-N domain-containing protein n=1 Tax=Danionella cerebrum TaxID=2873325 RepID=A0A553NM59_9TELE|nr:hypothetical protein DNTS_005358 [Danionella translucida]